MNRHERRKQRAQERKVRRDVMSGTYLTLNDVPEHVKNNPHFQKALKGELPPEYLEQIKKAAVCIVQWVREHPSADLRWVEQKNDGVFVSAALCDVRAWIADSPDAHTLLEWVDEQTGRQLSLNMFVWALRMCRAIPMSDGTYEGIEVTKKSIGLQALEDFAYARGTESRLPPSPCGHCGVILECASAAKGVTPSAGDVSICVKCYGFNRFDSKLHNVKVTDEQFNAFDETTKATLLDMQSTLRSYSARIAFGTENPNIEA